MADDLPPGMNQMDKNLHDWFPELPAEERFIESFKCNLKKPDWSDRARVRCWLSPSQCLSIDWPPFPPTGSSRFM